MTKICKYCGKEFEIRGKAIFCSDECRYQQGLIDAREYNHKKFGTIPLHERECIVCGKPFMQKAGRQKICSPECAHQRTLDRYKNNYNRKKFGEEKPKKVNKTMPSLDDLNGEQLLNYAKIQLETFKDKLKVEIPKGLMKAKERTK